MTVAEMEKISEFTPTGLTRCDGCSNGCSKAYVRFTKQDSEFLFCSHHANKHELILVSMGYMMTDRRDVLQAEVTAYKTVKSDDDNF